MKDMEKKYSPFLVKGPILIRFECLARNFNPKIYLPEIFCVPEILSEGYC